MSETIPQTLRRLATQSGADAATCRQAAERIEHLEAEVAQMRGFIADGGHTHHCIRCNHRYSPTGNDQDCPVCGSDGTDSCAHLKDPVLIWSGEHRAYWGPKRSGYYDRRGAGWYDRSEAQDLTSHCGPEKKIELHPARGVSA